MLTATTAALAAIIFVAYGVQTATGFGAALISVTLGAHLIPVGDVVVLVLTLSLGQCGYIAFRYRGSIDWRFLGRWVAPFMGVGTAAGAYIAGYIDGAVLRQVLGALILGLSLFELGASLGRRGKEPPPIGPVGSAIGLVGAGLMHGVYATGGPPLVYTMGRRRFEASAFRSTLTVVWLVLDFGLVSYFVIDGRYTAAHVQRVGLLVPAVILGIIAGERLFARIRGPRFMQLVFALLAAAAVGLLWR